METKNLTIKQQQFCKHYIENKGNATKAYMKAFGTKNYNTAKVESSKILTKPNITRKIKEIMEENGFNDVFVDLELYKMIVQDKNPMAKLKAISEYNKITRRYDEATYISNNTAISFEQPIDLKGKSMKELELIRQSLLNRK